MCFFSFMQVIRDLVHDYPAKTFGVSIQQLLLLTQDYFFFQRKGREGKGREGKEEQELVAFPLLWGNFPCWVSTVVERKQKVFVSLIFKCNSILFCLGVGRKQTSGRRERTLTLSWFSLYQSSLFRPSKFGVYSVLTSSICLLLGSLSVPVFYCIPKFLNFTLA